MEALQITRQMINFNKAIFNNTYAGITVMQDYSVHMMDGLLRQFPWITDASRKPFHDSLQYIKQTGEQYKSAVDQNFSNLEEMIDKK